MALLVQRLMKKIRSWLPLRSAESVEPLFNPFIAASDFYVGEKLCVYGDYLYRYDPTGQLPAAFIAQRDIKAGEKVVGDPTDSRRSDLTVIWWEVGK
ncbi:MAG TPA: hypothetical protein VJ302_26270 [Blastocatellia bacterium]|nr:hypothetical protein [Blastocatellia bacterium]